MARALGARGLASLWGLVLGLLGVHVGTVTGPLAVAGFAATGTSNEASLEGLFLRCGCSLDTSRTWRFREEVSAECARGGGGSGAERRQGGLS